MKMVEVVEVADLNRGLIVESFQFYVFFSFFHGPASAGACG